SGHGATDPANSGEYYFVTYDAQIKNLYGTALLMNDTNLFKGIDSERVVMITDACHSGGINEGIVGAKAADRFFSVFQGIKGKVALASSKADEKSWEDPKYANSVFTHFLLKGLRGEALDKQAKGGTIAVKDLYKYVYDNTTEATEAKQHPQIFSVNGFEDETPVFVTPTFDESLNVKVQFQYLGEDRKVRPLTQDAELKSGQHVGVTFQPDSDCYVYIFWWDSSGNVGLLFPNKELTDGEAVAKSGRTYWLPARKGEDPMTRWFVLDKSPGTETIHFVACRARNEKLEDLYGKLVRLSDQSGENPEAAGIKKEIDRRIKLMGFAKKTAITKDLTAAKKRGEQNVQKERNEPKPPAQAQQAASGRRSGEGAEPASDEDPWAGIQSEKPGGAGARASGSSQGRRSDDPWAADNTPPASDRGALFADLKSRLEIAGADAAYSISFRHDAALVRGAAGGRNR
ncbi:MAG: DUF4384 domain-containing protein, partial [Pseudomonadota bacterium]